MSLVNTWWIKMKHYSFELEPPKDFKNDYIVVAAKNPESAKKKLIKELLKINKEWMKVREFNKESKRFK